MFWTMSTTWRRWVDEPPAAVARKLESAEEQDQIRGTVGYPDFAFQWRIKNWRNSWQPNIEGELHPAGDGTLIEATLTPHLLVRLFTFAHAIPFFGLSWLMGVVAFTWHANRAIVGLDELLDVDASDEDAIAARQVLADPTQPGAEVGAPWAFRVTHSEGEVCFHLRHASWLGQKTTLLSVSASGVRVGERRLSWDELSEVHLIDEEGPLLLRLRSEGEPLDLPADLHARSDLFWLKDYLRSQDRRLGASEEDLDVARERLRQLQAMRRKST